MYVGLVNIYQIMTPLHFDQNGSKMDDLEFFEEGLESQIFEIWWIWAPVIFVGEKYVLHIQIQLHNVL